MRFRILFPCFFAVFFLAIGCGFDPLSTTQNATVNPFQTRHENLLLIFAHDNAQRDAAERDQGLTCVPLLEPRGHATWYDNYLCYEKSDSLSFTWSYAGKVAGQNCRQVFEPETPSSHTWEDNYLCEAGKSPFEFRFALNEQVKRSLIDQGFGCVSFSSDSLPHSYSWHDNSLCWRKIKNGNVTRFEDYFIESQNEDEIYPLRRVPECGAPTYKEGTGAICGQTETVANGEKCGWHRVAQEHPDCGIAVAAESYTLYSSSAACQPGFEKITRTKEVECESSLERNRCGKKKVVTTSCYRPARFNVCVHAQSPVHPRVCTFSNPQGSCRHEVFGIDYYPACRIRKTAAELDQFLSAFEPDSFGESHLGAQTLAMSMALSSYLEEKQSRQQLGCFVASISAEGSGIPQEAIHQAQAIYSSLTGEFWTAEEFEYCEPADLSFESIAEEQCGSDDLSKRCVHSRNFKRSHAWLEAQLREVLTLRYDRIALGDDATDSRMESACHKLTAALNNNLPFRAQLTVVGKGRLQEGENCD